MISVQRLVTLGYVLVVFIGGYFAVSGLKGLWTEAGHFERLASAGGVINDHTTLIFDSVEPAAGD